jgi:predicted ribosome quality control (RQC) complex YloA/Tae2 family protein
MTDDLDGIRVFDAADGWEILVGKTSRGNDRLSTRISKPADFWFHVAGMPGSHVIARHPQRPERLPREVKRLAAGLAAYFGKGRKGGRVAVHMTTCDRVSKPRGAAPGKVQIERFETLHVSPVDPVTL